MTRGEAIDLIMTEVDRAVKLCPEWPIDAIHEAALVCEEAGELSKAAIDMTYFYGDLATFKREAAHVAATAIRCLLGLDNVAVAAEQGIPDVA